MKRRDVLILGFVGLAAGALTRRPAFAQSNYPERPIKLVTPFVPGGVTDIVARLWADKVKTLLGSVVVENQGGAGGSIARTTAARANPDGYTLALGGGAQTAIAFASSHGPADAAKDVEPISILVVTALVIATHPSVPVHDLQELIAYAKAGAGKVSYGAAAPGSMAHLTGELFKSLIGTPDLVYIPYKGGGQSVADLVSGHIPIVTTNLTGQVLDLHRSGKIRVLAVTSPSRVTAAPDISTAVEAGVPGMIAQNTIGLFAPAGTPKAIITQVSQATQKALADEEFRQKLIASGFQPYPDSSPDAARRLLKEEADRLMPVIKAIGLKLE
jgi:tripartite-type tricarboxylate transporter receptor subunit TctC